MTAKIRLLDENTINKIAAGEVIENSASVIKELVQNSLDAGASEVIIETKGAGRSLISVTDNGCGMSQDDALLSIERHATSKLTVFDDLATLNSMGFRGEALPSIASISRFSLFTSEKKEGRFVRVEGGKLIFCKPIPMERGTRIEVEQLFYNVPVRRRFLSSPEKEEREIAKITELLALSRPQVKMALIQNGKKRFSLPSETFQERIFSIFGDSFKKELFILHCEEGTRRVEGMISSPLFHRGTRSHHFLFVNGRPITSPLIYQAVRDGFSTLLPQGRFPLFFLELTLDPSEIDVNVHPQKREVRFHREQEIRAFILHAVGKALSSLSTPTPVEWATSQLPCSASFHLYEESSSSAPWSWTEPKVFEEPPIIQEPLWRLIGTMSGYILCEREKGTLLLVDQKKAHSRILFEKGEEAHTPAPLFSVPLIVPYTFEFDREEAKKIALLIPELLQAGFDIRPFGPSSFMVESHPVGLSKQECEEVLHDLIKESEGTAIFQDKTKERAKKARILSLSSTAHLSKEEADLLLKNLFSCKTPDLSPEGKPVFRKIDIEEFMKV